MVVSRKLARSGATRNQSNSKTTPLLQQGPGANFNLKTARKKAQDRHFVVSVSAVVEWLRAKLVFTGEEACAPRTRKFLFPPRHTAHLTKTLLIQAFTNFNDIHSALVEVSTTVRVVFFFATVGTDSLDHAD